jgi:hypothetical protein
MIEAFKLLSTRLHATTRALLAKVAGAGVEGNDADAEDPGDVEVVHPIGFLARAALTSTTQLLAVRIADQVLGLFQVDKGATKLDCDEGEAGLYAPAEVTCRIRLRGVGKIEITAKAGQDLVLHAGSTPVAKEGSGTTGHLHNAGTMTAGPWPVVGATATATDTVATGAGSPRVKVP